MSSPAPTRLKAGILVVSTTASAGSSEDLTTPLLRNTFASANESTPASQWDVAAAEIVTDSLEDIQSVIRQWTDRERLNLVVTSGGTGFAENDVTPEAVSQLLHRQAPGLVHAMLSTAFNITPFAVMSRPVAGTRNSTIILTLPGSPKGAVENLSAVIKLLPHACVQAAGLQPSRKLHSGGLQKLSTDAGLTPQSPQATPQNARHTTLTTEGTTKPPGYHSCGHHHHHTPKPHANPSSSQTTQPGEPVPSRLRSSPWPMISVEEAHSLISAHTPIAPEIITHRVDSSLIGYVLAHDITAPVPVPAFRASIVDGYAVVGSDGPGIYPVVIVSHATPTPGDELPQLRPGQVARITTGAPVPHGATAVVMVEDTRLTRATEDGKEELQVEILASDMGAEENIRQVGSDVAMGSVILRWGTEVTAMGGEIGILASVGISEVRVYRKPVVGLLSTGDEVVEFDRAEGLSMGEIRDSNRPTLKAALRGWGLEVVDLGIVTDIAENLSQTLTTALTTADVLITTGGVSMGELDLLKPTIQHTLAGTIHFGRVAMKPGKPTTFATIPPVSPASIPKLIFALPGNPASALVTAHIFVLPALRQFAGFTGARRYLPKVKVALEEEVRMDPRREYVRGVVGWSESQSAGGGLVARTTGGQRSSRVGSAVGGNALLEIPGLGETEAEGRKVVKAGQKVWAVMVGMIRGVGWDD
ncbi:hypothetical protein EV426DRAFT_390002 [Tirmania nivea]|nr:hypothetical protein EV426DRAFT_390002 [Tirmania nivea]